MPLQGHRILITGPAGQIAFPLASRLAQDNEVLPILAGGVHPRVLVAPGLLVGATLTLLMIGVPDRFAAQSLALLDVAPCRFFAPQALVDQGHVDPGQRAVLADPAVVRVLDGRQPKKVIVVPERIVNVVV